MDREAAPKRECGHAHGAWRCVARPDHDGGHDMKRVLDPIDAPPKDRKETQCDSSS